MPDRDYYVRDEERFANVRRKYMAYAQKLLGLAGIPAADTGRIAAAVMKHSTSDSAE